MIMKKNKAHQMKSSHYYIFWGICTVAVVLGQLYVGSGYRVMSGSVNRLTNTLVTGFEEIDGSTQY